MLLISNGILHTMESDTPIRADILIDKGKIIKIKKQIVPYYIMPWPVYKFKVDNNRLTYGDQPIHCPNGHNGDAGGLLIAAVPSSVTVSSVRTSGTAGNSGSGAAGCPARGRPASGLRRPSGPGRHFRRG